MTVTSNRTTARVPAVRGNRARPRAGALWGVSGGAGVLAADGTVGYFHPAAGVVLAAAEAGVPMLIALILLAAILLGSSQTCERAFRLLRWTVNRPEPLAPEQARLATAGEPYSGA
jgi:hypothetical protein